MRVLVTGATGFVGRWLVRELASAGHEAIGTPRSSALDITDGAAVAALVAAVRPEAVAHLAAMSFGPDARREPSRALAIGEGGTRAIMEAVATTIGPVPVLVVSSSDVYGIPRRQDLPLRESAPLLTAQPYGLAKLAQERVAVEIGAATGIPLIIVRPFNHTGPGQRPEFVVPALASRVVAAGTSRNRTVRAGNVDVRRDISDVRDVVRAYRLLLETRDGDSRSPVSPFICNVASGRSVAIREVVRLLASMAGIEVEIEVDPSLVRPEDPPEICGDASLIGRTVGWHATIPLHVTLMDVLEEARSRRESITA